MNFRLFAIQLIRMQAEVHNFLAPLSLWWFSKYVTMSPLSPDSETAEAAEGGGGRRPIHEEERNWSRLNLRILPPTPDSVTAIHTIPPGDLSMKAQLNVLTRKQLRKCKKHVFTSLLADRERSEWV